MYLELKYNNYTETYMYLIYSFNEINLLNVDMYFGS